MRPSLFILLTWFVFSSLFVNGSPFTDAGAVWAEEEWHLEFSEICGMTNEAATLSTDDLTLLVGRCDALRKQIEQLGQERPTESKVYLKRLDKCKGLYEYMLRVKEKK